MSELIGAALIAIAAVGTLIAVVQALGWAGDKAVQWWRMRKHREQATVVPGCPVDGSLTENERVELRRILAHRSDAPPGDEHGELFGLPKEGDR